MASPRNLSLRIICEALGDIKTKWHVIGIQLGIPHSKLLEFENERDPLAAVVDYWLRGNATKPVVPISIVTALNSSHVQEPALAEEIQKIYESPYELNLQTICDTLGNIKDKWFAIGIQLGIPRSKLLEFEEERDPLSAVVDYWLRGNVTESAVPLSWRSIANALASKHVGEPGLARKIIIISMTKREPHRDIITEDALKSGGAKIHRNSEPLEDTKDAHQPIMDLDVKDRKIASEKATDEIIFKYRCYVSCILDAIKEKVSLEDFRSFLLTLSAFSASNKGQDLALLPKSELQEKKTINEIFDFLSTECASFMNCNIFQKIMEKYSIPEDRKELKYPDYLKYYCMKVNILEFPNVDPQLLENKKNSKQLDLKFNIENTCSLARLVDLQEAVAKILNLSCSALNIIDIKEGCVAVKFLIPSPVANAVFTSDKIFTPQQEKELEALSVLRVKCNGYTCFDQPDKPKKEVKIEIFGPEVEEQVSSSLSQLDALQKENEALQEHKAEIEATKNFTYTVDVTKFRKIEQPSGENTNTCLLCNFTCHKNCGYSQDDTLSGCSAINSDGYCKICPNKCHWSHHRNLPYVIEYYTATETRTSDDLKRRYDAAQSSKTEAEAKIAEIETELSTKHKDVLELIEQALQELREKVDALKPAEPNNKAWWLKVKSFLSSEK